MNVTAILPGLIAATIILSGCSGKDDPDATATSTSKGSTATTGDTEGTTSTGSSSTTATGTKTTSPSTSTADPTDPTDPTSATDTTGGCDFIACNRDHGEEEWCDQFAQDCPEGEKCMPWANDGGNSWNSTKCTPLDPDPQQPGEVCSPEGGGVSGVDNCAKASMCWDVDGDTNEGICVPFCQGSPEEPTCDPGFSCTITGDGVLILCLPDCDPLIQDCPGDDICIPDGNGSFICVLDASGEAGVYGDPCEFPNACDPGLYCLSPEYVEGCMGAGCCSPFCDTSEANTCPGDTQECIPWYEDPPPGKEDIGICGVPQ